MIKTLWSGSLLALLLSVIFIVPFLPLETQRQVEAPFLNESGSQKALVFFGFTHCAEICPAALGVLRNVMSHVDSERTLPQVAFVDIDTNSNPEQAQRHAEQFHHSFIGVHPNPAQLARLKSDFGLNFQQMNEQIQHRGRTYLLNRADDEWQLVKVFNPDSFDAESLAQELY